MGIVGYFLNNQYHMQVPISLFFFISGGGKSLAEHAQVPFLGMLLFYVALTTGRD